MAEGAPEKAPRRPWRLGHDGARRNPGNNAVESKEKKASRSVAHHDHAGVLDEDEDGLERLGHDEVDGGGTSAGSEEEGIASGDSGQPKQREQAEEERKTEAITLA